MTVKISLDSLFLLPTCFIEVEKKSEFKLDNIWKNKKKIFRN
jgi:hypothetical protein